MDPRLQRSGGSLLIGEIGRAWLPVARLLREIETVLLTPVAASLFLTPPNAAGFRAHLDTYDTMILQLSGAKDWQVYRPALQLPLHSQRRPVDATTLGEPCCRYRLVAGDLLYLPRGMIHETATGAEASMHLTLMLLPYRWCDLLRDVIDDIAEKHVELRHSIPRAAWRDIAAGRETGDRGLVDGLNEALSVCLREAAASAGAARHLTRFVESLRPLDVAIAAPAVPSTIGPQQRIARRPGLPCCVFDDEDNTVIIIFPGGNLRAPAAAKPAVQFIADTPNEFCLADLPGNLSTNAKTIFARRLIRDGLLHLPDT